MHYRMIVLIFKCLIWATFVILFGFIFVIMEFNMSGYKFMPSWFTSVVENTKLRIFHFSPESSVSVVRNRTLINIVEGMLDSSGQRFQLKERNNTTLKILWYNKPPFINITIANNFLATDCSYSNCEMDQKVDDLRNYAAIIYSTTDSISFKPPVPATDRDPNQIWIFFSLEPPLRQDYLSYRHNSWKNTMNWSMSYRLDSDVLFPYGTLKTRDDVIERDYSDLFRRKTKLAAWAVSHCDAPSKRDEYVSELRHYGVEVKIFGLCGDERINEQEFRALLQSDFKFLLSFENSFCKDYISEKFFRYYNLDTILVVRGGGDYERLLPNDTFINSAHFKSARELAMFLLKVGSSEYMFTKYLERKNTYISYDLFSMPTSYCSVCEKLNNVDQNKRTYVDHVTFIHNNTCWDPTDISFTKVTYNELYIFEIVALLCVLLLFCVITRRCLTAR